MTQTPRPLAFSLFVWLRAATTGLKCERLEELPQTSRRARGSFAQWSFSLVSWRSVGRWS
jgi:hypothetical protein